MQGTAHKARRTTNTMIEAFSLTLNTGVATEQDKGRCAPAPGSANSALAAAPVPQCPCGGTCYENFPSIKTGTRAARTTLPRTFALMGIHAIHCPACGRMVKGPNLSAACVLWLTTELTQPPR